MVTIHYYGNYHISHDFFLRDIRECGEISNLDCCQRLRSRCYHEETSAAPRKPLHNAINFERLSFRKSSNLSAKAGFTRNPID